MGQILGLKALSEPAIIMAIKNAKTLLAPISLNHSLTPVYKSVKAGSGSAGKNTKKLIRYNLGDKDIALAILDPATNNTTITIGRQNGKSMVFPDPAVDVKLVRFNGVNSKFQVNRPTNGTVVALKYLISSAESGSRAAIEKGLSEAIYVPSSPPLASAEVLKYGEDYLNNIVDQITEEFKHLPSRAFPGKMLTEAISPGLIKALIYAEHTDTGAILNGSEEAVRGSLSNLSILLAVNGNDAYKYSVSSAGARGIAQFMPATYRALTERHPEAGLISDFTAGMSDHKNSIKAMYLLLDDYAGAVRVKARNGFTEGQIFDYGAASYNGGVARVAKAVNMFGVNWNEDKTVQNNSLNAQISTLKARVKALALQIKKPKDKNSKTVLQAELTAAKDQLAAAQTQLKNLADSSLRNETINYLKKIYKVVHIFNGQQVAMK